ncbi:MAG TPA: hypothetical protein VK983_00460 [Candidatus Limnocylindrales bacterium]|nr:hypothetical protein [Candidatus Limnocylindrales bacterium]
MNSKRVYYAMVAAIVLLSIAIIGSAYAANTMLAAKSKELVELKLRDQVLSQEQTGLIKAKKDIERYDSLDKIAKAIVPQDKDQARAVREIIKIAADSGITPSSISFPVSTLGQKAAGSSAVAGGTPAGNSATGKTSLSQLKPVKDIKGVYVLKVTISQDAKDAVPYPRFIDFLSRLEQNRRTAQVSSIVLQPSPNNRSQVAFTLTLDEFIKP